MRSRLSPTQKIAAPYAATALSVLLTACGGGSSGGGSDGDSTGVQGAIDIASGSRVDQDYADLWFNNNESWPSNRNNSVDLPVPATAAGYLSVGSGTYANGRDYPSDSSDEYTVSLVEDDRYFLQCFPADDGSVDDLKVTLSLNSSAEITDTACGSGRTVTATGDYTIALSTTAGGPFRYVLTIAPQGALLSLDAGWPEPGIRVNEAVVSGPAAVASTLSSSGLQARSMMESMRAIGPDLWHVSRDQGATAMATGTAQDEDPRVDTIEWIRAMRQEFGLKVEPNYLFHLTSGTPGTNFYYDGTNEWNLDQIKMEQAWLRTGSPTGLNVGVAVMDTGLFSTNLSSYGNWHEDLDGNVVAEGGILDFVSSSYDVDGTGGRDTNPATPLTPSNPSATSFHGTHVAGIIAAQDNNLGTLGVAHQATILPYRVLGVDSVTGDDGVGSAADLIDAITTASDRSDVDVINLSLGGLPQLNALQQATDYAHSQGILVVAAGGNSGDASAVYPAANRRVVGVGATDRSGGLASYSNYGQSVDLLAPGGALNDGIINAYGDVGSGNSLSSGYAYLAGTSMAAPHVTGVFALMKDAADVTADQFRAQLIAGNLTDASSLSDYATYGEGLLDANKALDPTTRTDFPTVVSAWPRLLEVDPDGSESAVLLEVLKDSGAIDPTVDGAPTVPAPFNMTRGDGSPLQVGDPLNGSLRIRVEPASVPTGRPLAEEIVIPYSTDNGDPLVVPVYVQASDNQIEREAGIHYVLLLDADNFDSESSQGQVVRSSGGRYQYDFSGVDPGEYILVAGSDLDNNGFICENGEACAEYPRAGSRQVFSINSGEQLRLDMTTSFRRPSIAEMGLPRYGFEGYPVPDRTTGAPSADRELR